MREGKRNGNSGPPQPYLAAAVRVPDEVEQVVGPDGGEGYDRRLVADGRSNESIPMTPEEAVAKLAGFHRFAQAARKNENKLLAGEQTIGVRGGSVDRAHGRRQASKERYLPPGMLTKHPDGALELLPHGGHGEDGVPAERVVCDEQGSPGGRFSRPLTSTRRFLENHETTS